jgi:elongation factor Tu
MEDEGGVRRRGVSVGIVGDEAGRSALSAAIDVALAGPPGGRGGDTSPPPVAWRVLTDCVRDMIIGLSRVDVAVLVVSAAEGPQRPAREAVLLARQLGVPAIVVFIDEADRVRDGELLDLVELEVRELLSAYGFPGERVPVVRGSARGALEAKGKGPEAAGITRLLRAVERSASEPAPAPGGPFLMLVREVFPYPGRGTLVIGRVERGAVSKDDEIEIVGPAGTTRAVVTDAPRPPGLGHPGDPRGNELPMSVTDEGGVRGGLAGEDSWLVLPVDEDAVEPGQVLAGPGSIVPQTWFTAAVYLLSEREGGAGAPLVYGDRAHFHFQEDVLGTAHLLHGVDRVMPGVGAALGVELSTPTPIGPGQRFSIREQGRTLGAGVVTGVGPWETVLGASRGGFGAVRSGGVSGLVGSSPPSSGPGLGLGGAGPIDTGTVGSSRDEVAASPSTRRLFADLTLFDATGATRIDDTRDALCEGERYVLEVALRGRRTGAGYRGGRPEPVAPPPAGESARILVVVSARDTDFAIGEPVQFLHLPARIDADSRVDALFRCETKRRPTSVDDLAELEVRLYYELNLIEHIVLVAEVRGRHDRGSGSALGLTPPIEIRQMEGVGRSYADIVRDLHPRHMSVDLRTVESGVQFSVTIGTGEGTGAEGAHEVFLHGRCDLGEKDLVRAVNRVRDLWRDVAMDRFAGVVEGSARTFKKTLRDLAVEGRNLWSLLFRGAQDSAMWNIGEWIKAHPPAQGALVEVRLLDGARTFVFPWALLYDGPDPATEVDLAGFWGLRYAIEQKPVERLVTPDRSTDTLVGLELAFMVWESFPNAGDQATLLDGLAERSHGRLRVRLPPVNDADAFYRLAEECDSDILYFFAHGHTRPTQADADYHELDRFRERYESLAEDSPQRAALKSLYEMVTQPDFEPEKSWIALSGGRLYLEELRARTVQLTRRPVVFLNMCESAQVLPGLTESFVTFFLDRRARSVIGTECPMTSQFAHPFSACLLSELLEGAPLGEALRRARVHFIERRNPLGLAYTLFGSGTTRYDPAVLEPTTGGSE